ncbi:hypothetical protein MPSEU_001031000 [Mayamaea pseudoterrestris]|nr:hypothetical protein MPSEU_001031000 [Mayamaea pseudoterrestris]
MAPARKRKAIVKAAPSSSSKRKSCASVTEESVESHMVRPAKRSKKEVMAEKALKAKLWVAQDALRIQEMAAAKKEVDDLIAAQAIAALMKPAPVVASQSAGKAGRVKKVQKQVSLAAVAPTPVCKPVAFVAPQVHARTAVSRKKSASTMAPLAAAVATEDATFANSIVYFEEDHCMHGDSTLSDFGDVRVSTNRLGGRKKNALLKLVLSACAAAVCWYLSILGVLVLPTSWPVMTTYAVPQLARCFVNSDSSDTFYTERCAMAVATNKIFSCPNGGSCEGGELISCGADHFKASVFVPSADRMSCDLSLTAKATLQMIIHRLKELTVADMCFQQPSMKIRNSESWTGSLMVDFFDLANGLDEHASIDADTPAWLEFALVNGLASGLNLEMKKESVWIGLSSELVHQLALPTECRVERAINSTWDSIKALIWGLLFKKAVSFLGAAFRQHLWICAAASLVACIVYAVQGKCKAVSKHNDDVQRAKVLVYNHLKASSGWVKVDVIRDEVKSSMFPGNYAAQVRFVSSVWKTAYNQVDRDERVGSRIMYVDGRVCDIWQWQGLER